MQEFDVALKLSLQSSVVAMRELAGAVAARWLGVELPKVQNPRVDLLCETVDGSLVHFELQSSNDRTMPLRMAEYYLGLYRLHNKFPRQILLYVGEAPFACTASFVALTCRSGTRPSTFANWMANSYWRASNPAIM